MGLGRMTSINYSHGPAQDQTQGWLVHNQSYTIFGPRKKKISLRAVGQWGGCIGLLHVFSYGSHLFMMSLYETFLAIGKSLSVVFTY